MVIKTIFNRFTENRNKIALYSDNEAYSYDWLLNRIKYWSDYFVSKNIKSFSIVLVKTSNNHDAIAIFLACIVNKITIIPITPSQFNKIDEILEISTPDFIIDLTLEEVELLTNSNETITKNSLYSKLVAEDSGGLVLFSSGTTGVSKATLHSFNRLLFKYEKVRKDYITLAFMFIDHIGGVDTLLYCLSNISTIVLANNRTTNNICNLIEKHKIEVLPTTPSFLNLLLLSGDYEKYDLSSLKYITYGTEPMPKTTLEKCNIIFKNVNIIQKFGATEVGTLGTKSESSNSTWMKLGGVGFETRIRENKLEIKSHSAMLGYLNAPDPFTIDGWFKTNDNVEIKDGFYRILGRDSEIINVGGEKVFPAEVENIILQLEEIIDARVFGKSNSILGNIVACEVVVKDNNINKKDIKNKIKQLCKLKLDEYKVPVKISFTYENNISDRFKKKRNNLP